MRSLKLWLPIAILVAGGAAAALIKALAPEVERKTVESTAPLVRAAIATPQRLQYEVEAHGTVVPRTESDLVPQVSGEVVWVSPDFVSGGFFEAGDPLVRLAREDYEADLESAKAALARAESEFVRARKERDRQRRLAKSSVASESRIDDADNAFRVAEATVREARARLARAERDLERTELTASYSGRVRSRQVDVGEFVTAGTPLASLYAIDFAEIRLPLPDREIAYLDLPLAFRDDRESNGSSAGDKEGQPVVDLEAEFAGARHVWQGRIVRTEGEIDPQSRMVHVVARVEDPYGRRGRQGRPPLAVGLFVDATIRGKEVESVSVLPRSALRDGERILVIDGEDRLWYREVELLRVHRESIVVGRGLEAGERVLVSPLRGVVDGMRVRVLDPEALR